MSRKQKHLPISIHKTLYGTLEVNWQTDYDGSLCCQECGSNRLQFSWSLQATCKARLYCAACLQKTSLTCRVPRHIFGYQLGKACPNPLCTQIGPDDKTKGWVFLSSVKYGRSKCFFCGAAFVDSEQPSSWVGRQKISLVNQFRFEDDIWDLRSFYENPRKKTLNFSNIQPDWYKQQVKGYLYYLLKARVYKAKSIDSITVTFRQFGAVVGQWDLQQSENITRDLVLTFLDSLKRDSSSTLRHKLTHLRDFFEWLKLDSQHLVRNRDYPKVSIDDPDWLDETVRAAIQQHLHKIPVPIACQYLVQEYTAARVGDVCCMSFDCLVEENSQWYIQFYQQKVQRWHRLLATREIRKVIEQQQQWIRSSLGETYPYLFCHFWVVQLRSYPNFIGMKPIPETPPVDLRLNQMVRIIRFLIEAEDIQDANGQRPHFTGKITRSSRLQEVRVKHGIEAAQLYADHLSRTTTFQNYAPPTQEQVARVDLPFQELLLNPTNRFLPWQSLPESLLKNPQVHELDMEISPRFVVYGHCALDAKIPCPHNLYPKCYGCSSFRSSTDKLSLYEQQYAGEKQRMEEAHVAGAELAFEEAKATVEAMETWLPELRRLANG